MKTRSSAGAQAHINSERDGMRDDDDTIPATASEVAIALKGGDIDALVELAKSFRKNWGQGVRRVDARLVYELLPASAREQMLADGAKAQQTS